MPFEIPISEDARHIRQNFIQFGVEIINFIKYECFLVAGVISFVLLDCKL